MIVDTHCHLDLIKQDPQSLVNNALEAQVERMITITTNPHNLDVVNELTLKFAPVYGSQGIHPHEAKNHTPAAEEKIKKNCQENSKIVAIGEIGLDYHYLYSSKEEQHRAFISQFTLAEKLQLPVIIHTRDAEEDTWPILQAFASKVPAILVHSFTGSLAFAEKCWEHSFFMSFNGIITFKNAAQVREVACRAPSELLLVETDAPFLAPVPFRGKENQPAYTPHVLETLAQVRGCSVEDLAPIIRENTRKIFHI